MSKPKNKKQKKNDYHIDPEILMNKMIDFKKPMDIGDGYDDWSGIDDDDFDDHCHDHECDGDCMNCEHAVPVGIEDEWVDAIEDMPFLSHEEKQKLLDRMSDYLDERYDEFETIRPGTVLGTEDREQMALILHVAFPEDVDEDENRLTPSQILVHGVTQDGGFVFGTLEQLILSEGIHILGHCDDVLDVLYRHDSGKWWGENFK